MYWNFPDPRTGPFPARKKENAVGIGATKRLYSQRTSRRSGKHGFRAKNCWEKDNCVNRGCWRKPVAVEPSTVCWNL
jgi:hypothetical protein